jgi:hypothetical protein
MIDAQFARLAGVQATQWNVTLMCVQWWLQAAAGSGMRHAGRLSEQHPYMSSTTQTLS